MALFGIWADFGFRENPYSQDTLGADETGDELLVGRDGEVQAIQQRIGSGGSHPSVEGPVGVGKTSLLNVAAYRMAKTSTAARSRELYLPATERFQPSKDLVEFEANVYRSVAQTLIRYADSFKHVGLEEPDVDALNRWLNSPQYGSWQAGVQVLGNGPQVGRGMEPNTGEGFTRSGFPETVRQVLTACFPSGTGGIICILDNLEIVETAGEARARLDELRDRLFNIPQLRWVLCGSRGIVSRARTERLSGVFQAPMIVGPLNDDAAIEAIKRRIDYFGGDGAQAPVTPAGFEFIYRALNKNLREALNSAQEFAHWIAAEYIGTDVDFPEADARDQLLQAWLTQRAENAFRDANPVQPRGWQFFDELCRAGGRVGSAEFERFGFGKQQQMVSAVTTLMNANLVVREVDPDNSSRTVNSVTALGWLVFFYKANFEMPPPRVVPVPSQ